eukprot:SAG22_NODE_6140_length_893_cov_1.784635_2_plen_87_part_01
MRLWLHWWARGGWSARVQASGLRRLVGGRMSVLGAEGDDWSPEAAAALALSAGAARAAAAGLAGHIGDLAVAKPGCAVLRLLAVDGG